MKFKVRSLAQPSAVFGVEQAEALSRIFADIPVKVLRSSRGRVVLDTGDNSSLQALIVQRLREQGLEAEGVVEFVDRKPFDPLGSSFKSK